MGDIFYVIGGGPGGVGAAHAAGKMGYKVVVVEAMERLAFKPCGRGIPVIDDLPFSIPRDARLNKVKYVNLYVDDIHAFKAGGWIDGVIVDKTSLLEHAFSEVGAEVYYKSRYNVASGLARIGGESVEVKFGVFSGGFPYYDGEKIPVVQLVLDNVKDVDFESLEIRFNTGLLGYYYIFPHGDSVEAGIGGFSDYETLGRLLGKFVNSDARLKNGRVLKKEAAAVSVGGLRLGYINGLVKVGEAAGYVLPLTGEGIRPSIIAGYKAARALLEGEDPVETLRGLRVSRAIKIQRRILEWTKRLSVAERRNLLLSLSPMDHAEVALGTLRLSRLIKSLLSRPRIALTLLPKILLG